VSVAEQLEQMGVGVAGEFVALALQEQDVETYIRVNRFQK